MPQLQYKIVHVIQISPISEITALLPNTTSLAEHLRYKNNLFLFRKQTALCDSKIFHTEERC
jgi:hypothetical protein